MDRFLLTGNRLSNGIETGDRQQTESDQEETGHRSTTEGNSQGCVHAVVGCLGCAHIGSDGDNHSNIAGDGRGSRADQETDRSKQTEFIRHGSSSRQDDE